MADRFDKFTERARRVLTNAEQEAKRLKSGEIATEHLLLGLVVETDGVANKIFSNLGLTSEKIKSAVEAATGIGVEESAADTPLGLTPRSKKVIELAVEEARRLNHAYIGTEHLLLGLVREGEGTAAGILESMGLPLEHVRAQTARILSQQGSSEEVNEPPIPKSIVEDRNSELQQTVDNFKQLTEREVQVTERISEIQALMLEIPNLEQELGEISKEIPQVRAHIFELVGDNTEPAAEQNTQD